MNIPDHKHNAMVQTRFSRDGIRASSVEEHISTRNLDKE